MPFYFNIDVAKGFVLEEYVLKKWGVWNFFKLIILNGYFTFVVFNAEFTFFIASSKFSSSSGIPFSFFKIPYWRKKKHTHTHTIILWITSHHLGLTNRTDWFWISLWHNDTSTKNGLSPGYIDQTKKQFNTPSHTQSLYVCACMWATYAMVPHYTFGLIQQFQSGKGLY